MSLQPGCVFSGDFRVERELSRGGMGQVYVATQLSTGRARALKVMRPELVQDAGMRKRFEQEARVAAHIKSDHIVEVIAAGVDDSTGMPWLAMELLEGESLGERIARTDGLSHGDAAELLDQLAHALAAAHAVGVIHRDLKPENVFVAKVLRASEGWTVKVLDFGIAKVIAEAHATATAPLGTLFWMAPEQADAAGVIGPATDVWAYGLIAFDAIAGRPFWDESASVPVLVRKLTLDPIPAASERARQLGREARLPPGFDGWFSRCVVRDVPARFVSIAAANDALQQLLRTSSASLAPTEPVDRLVVTASSPRKTPRSARVAWLAIAAGALVIGALALRGSGTGGTASRVAPGAGSALPAASVVPPDAGLKLYPEDEEDHETAYAVPLDDSPRRGAVHPLLTIVEFGEFQCPFARGFEDRLGEILTAYPEDVAVVWKDLPLAFHPVATPAARLARLARAELGDDGFWRAHDKLFAACANSEREQLERVGRELGLSAAKVRGALDAPQSDGIDHDVDESLDLGGFGTPTSFFNGHRVTGNQPLSHLRLLIDRELGRARALVASGVPRERVYEQLQRGAVAIVAPPRKVIEIPRTGPVIAGAHAVLDVHEIGDETNLFTGLKQPIVEYILREYGDRIRFHWHFAPDADDATAARVASFSHLVFVQNGNDVFWKLHRLLIANEAWPFKDPSHPSSLGFADDTLFAFAQQAGANPLYLRDKLHPRDDTEEFGAMRKLVASTDPEVPGLLYCEGYSFGGTLRGTHRMLEQLLATAGK